MEIRLKSTMDLLEENEKPPREAWAPLEVSPDHLLITPPSHFAPRKVRGLVVGFTWQRGAITIIK
jgi:hypothetical protein